MADNKIMLNRIVWAVSAFPDEKPLQRRMAEMLRVFTRKKEIPIQPVHVLSPDQLFLRSTPTYPGWSEQYLQKAEKSLHELLRQYHLKGMLRPKVLIQRHYSLTRSVKTLGNYVKRTDLLATSTHAKRGVTRFVLGSFAETLITLSRAPVLVVNPATHKTRTLKHILFPTDLEPLSNRVLREVVSLAKAFGASVTIFHKAVAPLVPIGKTATNVDIYFEKEVVRRERETEALARWARKKGVKVTVVIDDKLLDVADSITSFGKKQGCDLIMMLAQNQPLVANLLGSVTRQVVRSAPCPVYVVK